ncbi:MAG: hypothetical protein IJU03_09655 [Thermoguttaceae bacterium]|nr:hypothetical protein [Thermoguttaceae bacterium]
MIRLRSAVLLVSLTLLLTSIATALICRSNSLSNVNCANITNNDNDISVPLTIFPTMMDSEREVAFQSLTGQIENTEPLLQSIRNEAQNMEIFPLDFIVDYSQLDKKYAESEGAFNISLVGERTNQILNEASQDSEAHDVASIPGISFSRYEKVAQLCVDSSTDDFRFKEQKIDLIRTRQYLDKRYDITYDRFISFYRFYLSAITATSGEIEECFEAFDEMTTKEKALALTALYIFEQRVRKPTSRNSSRYKDKEFKYSTHKETDPFSKNKWESLILLLHENEQSEEVVFEAIPNEGLVEEWERSFRTHALIFQRDLSIFNPYFQTEYHPHYWYGLCRLAPIDFLYAFLITETDESFLKSNKPFPRRNTSVEFPLPEPNYGQDTFDNVYVPSIDFIEKNAIRCDALEFYNKTLPLDFVHYGGEKWNVRLQPNDAIVFMRAYLNTQFAFSRRYVRPVTSGTDSWIDVTTGEVVVDNSYNAHSIGVCNANTSAAPKTLGYIASTLLHARSLFDDAE